MRGLTGCPVPASWDMHDIFDRGLVRWVLIAASSRVHLVGCNSDFAKAEYAMITVVSPNLVYTPRLCMERFQRTVAHSSLPTCRGLSASSSGSSIS